MKNFTAADVRTAALESLELDEVSLGTGVLTVTEARGAQGWDLVYGDSGGTSEGHVIVQTGPDGDYLLVHWFDEDEYLDEDGPGR